MSETHEVRALAIVPRSVGEVMQLAELLAKSELLPKALRGKAADVALMIMAGTEMGFGPGTSLRSIHVIEGRPSLSASAKVALVRASGKAKYFDCVEDTDDRVTYETMRVESMKPQRWTYTRQDVKNAGLNTKDNHRLFSRQMMHARCKSALCENVYEDVINGIATTEDVEFMSAIEDRVPQFNDAIDAEVVSEDVTLPAEFDAIEAAESVDACKALLTGVLKEPLTKLTQAQKRLANERYKAALKALRDREQRGAA